MIEETAGNEVTTSVISGKKRSTGMAKDTNPVSARTRRKPKLE